MATTTRSSVPSISANKAVVLRWHSDVFERDDYKVVDEICTPDFVWHNDALQPELRTLEGTKDLARAMREGFSDYRLPHLEGVETVERDDMVVTFWKFVGTHDGPFLGAPATGKRVEMSGIDAFRLEDGRIAELWQELNMLGWLQQIGLVPSD